VLLRETPYFSAPEKASVRSHSTRYAEALDLPRLPAIQVHHDWILRNIPRRGRRRRLCRRFRFLRGAGGSALALTGLSAAQYRKPDKMVSC
jgi:hypothetical protein